MRDENISSQNKLEADTEGKDPEDVGITFLLAEFQFISEYRKDQVQIADRRVDVLLTLASAVIGGLALLFTQTNSIDLRTILLVGILGAVFLTAVGLITFEQVVYLAISITEHTRAINRIRYYFSEKATHIKPYLLLPVSHSHPPYDWKPGGRRVVAVVNSLVVGLLFSFTYVFLDLSARNPSAVGARELREGSVLFFITLLLVMAIHERHARRVFRETEAKASLVRQTAETLFASRERFDAKVPSDS